jgi:hypothetical protein
MIISQLDAISELSQTSQKSVVEMINELPTYDAFLNS